MRSCFAALAVTAVVAAASITAAGCGGGSGSGSGGGVDGSYVYLECGSEENPQPCQIYTAPGAAPSKLPFCDPEGMFPYRPGYTPTMGEARGATSCNYTEQERGYGG